MDEKALLLAAEDVAGLLHGHQVEAVVIGAVALAAYHYVRQTEDIDLGVVASSKKLQALAETLQKAGYKVTLHLPGTDDPLGGVLDVTTPAGLIQVVSFAGRFPRVIEDAIRLSTLAVRPGSPLRLVPLPHLIALKLYAGGTKSKADILELFARNPDLKLSVVKKVCSPYRLRGLNALIREAGLS